MPIRIQFSSASIIAEKTRLRNDLARRLLDNNRLLDIITTRRRDTSGGARTFWVREKFVSVAQFIVSAVISVLVTLPAVVLIPRARQSPTFDRVLWVGTAAFAFVAAWFVLGNLSPNLPALNGLVIGEVAVIPALVGAAIGAFALNGLLWLMDFSSRPEMEDDPAIDELSQDPAVTPSLLEEGESINTPIDPNAGQ
jgi:hypothetical protein